jgi:N-acetylglutamate synthase-like GNAT family acetyltransferase
MVQGMMSMLFSHPNVYSVVAEMGEQIVGSNFLWEESTIAGVGPIAVAPHIQNATVGKRLMELVLQNLLRELDLFCLPVTANCCAGVYATDCALCNP